MVRKQSIGGKADSADPGFVVADNEGSEYVVHQRSVEAAADDERLTDEEQAFYSAAFNGLNSGDLDPLAAYLRSPYRLNPALARLLADCIDNPAAFWRVDCTRRKTRKGTFLDAVQERQRIARIGYFIDQRNPCRGQLQVAIGAAMKEFAPLGERQARKIWAAYKRYRKQGRIQNGFWMGSLGAQGVRSIISAGS